MGKKAWQVKVYLDVAQWGLVSIMPLVELTVIFEREDPPSSFLIGSISDILIPAGTPLVSEIVLVSDGEHSK